LELNQPSYLANHNEEEMNKNIIIISILAILITSCRKEIFNDCFRGNGNIVTEEITIEEIKGLSLSSDIILDLTQGSEQKIFITTHQNIIDRIKERGEVKGDRWDLGLNGCVKSDEPIRLDVTLSDLNYISLAGDGEVMTTSPFSNLDEVEISVSGDSRMNLDLGSFQHLKTTITGDSDMTIIGSAPSSKHRITGDATLTFDKLSVETCDIQVTGDAHIRVRVEQELNLKVTGDANICYFGDPVVNQQVIGDLTLSRCF